MLNLLKGMAARKQEVARLYDGLVSRAREPVFFAGFGVTDSLDGRFDILVLHAWLVLKELKDSAVAQALTDMIFTGFDEALRILKSQGFPTKTVLCANDRVAFGVLAAAYQLGLKVGHGADCDLRVAGHDDHPLSRYACPPITTVAQNYNEIGRLAIELLLQRLDEKSPAAKPGSGRILLNAELMLRSSA